MQIMTMPKLSSRLWEGQTTPEPEFYRMEKDAAYRIVLSDLRARRQLLDNAITALEAIRD